jgi:hypothetical protein
MGQENNLYRFAALTEQAAERAGRGGPASLAPLLAEMMALGSVLPGLAKETDQERLAHEDEVEAGFDNVPI